MKVPKKPLASWMILVARIKTRSARAVISIASIFPLQHLDDLRGSREILRALQAHWPRCETQMGTLITDLSRSDLSVTAKFGR
jgi:hypothetical protein